jgi:hypothetical protein
MAMLCADPIFSCGQTAVKVGFGVFWEVIHGIYSYQECSFGRDYHWLMAETGLVRPKSLGTAVGHPDRRRRRRVHLRIAPGKLDRAFIETSPFYRHLWRLFPGRRFGGPIVAPLSIATLAGVGVRRIAARKHPFRTAKVSTWHAAQRNLYILALADRQRQD